VSPDCVALVAFTTASPCSYEVDSVEPVPSEEQMQTVAVHWWHCETVNDRESVNDDVLVYLPWHPINQLTCNVQ